MRMRIASIGSGASIAQCWASLDERDEDVQAVSFRRTGHRIQERVHFGQNRLVILLVVDRPNLDLPHQTVSASMASYSS